MRKIIKRLDWYIIKQFLGTYFFSIALIMSIAVVFDINEKIDDFLKPEIPLTAIIFEYYKNFIPYFANLFSALFVFISVIFFTSKLADKSEIIAILSSGVSFKRLMRPYLISAALIAILNFFLSGYVIPAGNVERLNFEDTYIKKRGKVNMARNVQLQVADGVIAYMESYEESTKTGTNFSLDQFKDKKLISHLTAKSITYDTLYNWHIKEYMIRELDGLKEHISSGTKIDSLIQMEPSDFLIARKQQEMFTSPELREYISKQKQRGFANIKEFEIEYERRIAISLASFILTIIGVSISSRKVKGGMGLHLGIGLALSFTYIMFQTVSATFAISGGLPPIVAVWIPNSVFAIVAVVLYRKTPK